MLTNSRTSASNVNEDFIASSPYLWVRCLVLKSLRMNARQQFVFGLVPTCTVSALIRTYSGLSIQNGPDTLDWLDRSLASHSTCMNLRSRSEHGHEISNC